MYTAEGFTNPNEQLAPFVKELQSYGITFDLILPYLMAVNEKSVLQNMNQKDAAREIAQYLRAYRNLESLQKAVEKAERQLKCLDAFSTINNQAITTLINLKLAGYSEKDVMDLARWSKYHQLGSPGLAQGNGQGNGSSSNNNNDNNGGGSTGKWRLDDKLNVPQNN
jgi:transposase